MVCKPMGGGEVSSQMLTTAYKEKEEFKVAYVRKEIIFLNSFFVQQKLLHCYLLLYIEECKLSSGYKLAS